MSPDQQPNSEEDQPTSEAEQLNQKLADNYNEFGRSHDDNSDDSPGQRLLVTLSAAETATEASQLIDEARENPSSFSDKEKTGIGSLEQRLEAIKRADPDFADIIDVYSRRIITSRATEQE